MTEEDCKAKTRLCTLELTKLTWSHKFRLTGAIPPFHGLLLAV